MEIEYGSENSINKSPNNIEWTYATYLGVGGVEDRLLVAFDLCNSF